MRTVRGHRSGDLPAWAAAGRTAVAIGNFDGVHAGHRALIARARTLAATHGARAVALTFDPHPSAVLSPRGAPAMLGTLERRLELLEAAGLDGVVVEPFTRALAAMSPDAFFDEILVQALCATAIVVGYDFSYGCDRSGTTQTLAAQGARAGIEVSIVPPVEVEGEIVSSSKIRGYLRAGDLRRVTARLGRPWDIDGEVVHGAKRGRAIGVPTANIATRGDVPIASGIYAVTLAVDGAVLPGVASLGTNPTFVEDGKLVLEVHLLDWDGDLYGRRVRTAFVARLRDEEKYDSIEALLAQIARDIAAARRALAAG